MSDDIKIAHPKRIITLVVLMSLIVGSAVDIFVPSLPHIATYFKTSAAFAGLSVTVYLIAYGIFQLVYGSLTDTFGRRKIVICSLIGYIVFTYFIVFSKTIYIFLVMRFLQGIFTAGLGVSNRAMLSDSFSGKALSKYASYALMAWAAGPIVSPYIGGYMQLYFGWQANFYLLTAYSVIVCIITIILLPETCQHYTPFHIRHFFSNYKLICFNKYFMSGALICGLMYGFITVYNVIGPFLIQTELGYGPTTYGEIALFLGLGWLIGILIFRYKLAKLSEHSLFPVLVISMIIALIWLIFGIIHLFNLVTTVLPAILLFVCGAISFSSSFAKALSLFSKI